MAVRKRPPGRPTAPGPDEGIRGIQQSPFALRAEQIIPETGPRGGVLGEYDSAKAELESVDLLIERAQAARASFGAGGVGQAPATEVVFNERVYDLPALDKEIARLKKIQARSKKRFTAAEKVVKPLQNKVDEINRQINGAGDNDAKKRQLLRQLAPAEAALEKAKAVPVGTPLTKEVVKKETSKKAAAPTTTTAPARTAQGQQVTPAMRAAQAVTPEAAAMRQPTTPTAAPTATPTATTGGGGTGGTGETRRSTRGPKGAPASPTTGQRYVGPKGATFQWDGKKWNRVQAQEWASIVQEEFGPLWDVYNTNNDVKEVIDRSISEGFFNDPTKLEESLRNTDWFRTTERAARNFAIRQSTDPAQIEDEIMARVEDIRQSASTQAITFDDGTLRRLATDSIKYGWTPQQQVNAVGSEAVAQARRGGARGMADLRSGFVAQELRKTASDYAYKPSDTLLDTWVADVMSGKKTQEQWVDLMRSSAATQFRSLQPALDKGIDVKTAMFSYEQQARRMLGDVMDLSEIDWTSDKWNRALNYRDEKTGEYRQMDLWEWNQYLRGMDEWKQTDEAKNIYGNITMSLSQAFSTRTPQGMNP